jgi:hypothetical protein
MPAHPMSLPFSAYRRQVLGLLLLRERLGREVNPVVMTRAEFAAQRAAKERFVERVMREPKLFVLGSADDLG